MAGKDALLQLQQRWWLLFPDQPAAAVDNSFQRLRSRYDELHRAYHTFEHIDACLHHLDRHYQQLNNARAVELALWYHDVIYDTRAGDNEVRSARFAANELRELGEPATAITRVERLIEVTEHPSKPQDDDEAVLLDIDLAILGAPPEVYDQYERQVRREYRWVPGFLYRRGRRKVLTAFLEAPSIYHSPAFKAEREGQARENLDRALSQLGG